MRGSTRVLWFGLTLIATPILAILLLYAYRSQSPAVPTVSVTDVIQEIRAGAVREVVIDGSRATVTLALGSRQTTQTSGRPDDPLIAAINEHNNQSDLNKIALRYESSGPFADWSPLILGLLPILVIVALLLAAIAVISRSGAGDRHEQLARIADLRDRGVLTEQEFQREKGRLMR